MSNLPDELWRRILEIGVETSGLTHRDLCRISICSSRLLRLASDPSLWAQLLSRDFPSSSSTHEPSKSLYKTKFERDKARKVAAWRLGVLKVESQVAVCAGNVANLRSLLRNEHAKWKAAAAELARLENVRRSTVALNVWQPEIVRSSQRKTVEQCTVPIESRISALQMEIRVCRQQVAIYDKACKDQERMLDERKEELRVLKYHPVYSFQLKKTIDSSNRKRKRSKQFSGYCCK